MNQYDELKKRIERLEQIIFKQADTNKKIQLTSSASGPTAGIKFLKENGFFNPPNRRVIKDIMSALLEQGKDYSPQAVNIALRRLSKGKKATLICHKEKTGNAYVART